jgi:hypothetical protein
MKDAHHLREPVVREEHVEDKRVTRDQVVLLQLDLQLGLQLLLILYSATATAAAGGGPAAASECVLLYK